MSTYRAYSLCPICNQQEEVWFYYGKIKPFSDIQCNGCGYTYDANNYISAFIDLYQNITVSANAVTNAVTN